MEILSAHSLYPRAVGSPGQMVRDALVAIDAGQPGLKAGHHAGLRSLRHLVHVHRIFIVTIAALTRVARFHAGPDVLGQRQPMLFELLRRADRAENLVPELVARLDFPLNQQRPRVRNMAVGARGAHAELILVVNSLLILLIDGIAHFVTGDAELQLIRFLYRPVEAAPEQEAPNATEDDQCRKGEPPARAPQHRPNARNESSLMIRSIAVVHDSPYGASSGRQTARYYASRAS